LLSGLTDPAKGVSMTLKLGGRRGLDRRS